MRDHAKRKLTALGFAVTESLPTRRFESLVLQDLAGRKHLHVSTKILGPSWPQIQFALVDYHPRILTIGGCSSLLITDCKDSREALEVLDSASLSQKEHEVFLEDVGFVRLDDTGKPSLKKFLLPSLAALVALTLGVSSSAESSPQASLEIPTTSQCTIDSDTIEFRSWLSKALSSQGTLANGDVLQISTVEGNIELTVDGALGSTLKISGFVYCDDGRQQAINHRIDASGNGAVLPLGQ